MATALFAPPDSIAPGLAGALGALGRSVDELPWGGDLRNGVALAGQDVLVTVAPRPQLGPLAAIEPAAWTAGHPRHRRAAGRGGARARCAGRRGKRWIAIIPHLSSLPSPGSGPYGAGGIMLADDAARRRDRERRDGFCANAIAVAPFAGVLDADSETILREDTPRGNSTQLEELAALVHWLAGEAPASLNGETLKLDGGFSLTRKPRPAPSAEVEEWLVEPEWRAERARQPSRARSSARRRWLSRAWPATAATRRAGVARGERGDDRGVLLADQVEVGNAAPARAPGDARLVVEGVERAPQLGVARGVQQRLVEALVVVHERDELAVALLAVLARADLRVDLAQTCEIVVGRALAGADGAGALDHLARLEEVVQLGQRQRRQRRSTRRRHGGDELLSGQARQRLAHGRRAHAQAAATDSMTMRWSAGTGR